MAPEEPGRGAGGAIAGAAVLGRRQILPVEVVRDDLRFFANHALGAAVAPFREQAAELVDHFVGVEPDALGVVAHVAAREDTLGPAGQVAVFQRLPELDAELGLGGQLLEGDALSFAGCPEDRPKVSFSSRTSFTEAKSLPTKS